MCLPEGSQGGDGGLSVQDGQTLPGQSIDRGAGRVIGSRPGRESVPVRGDVDGGAVGPTAEQGGADLDVGAEREGGLDPHARPRGWGFGDQQDGRECLLVGGLFTQGVEVGEGVLVE